MFSRLRSNSVSKETHIAAGREPAVTIVIPTYDRPEWLGDAIESALAQSYTDFTLIVSDNVSGPETEAVVRRYADPRLRYVRLNRHVDMNTHFSMWLRRIRTRYLFLLPDDDLIYPDLLETAVGILEQNPQVGAVHGEADVVDAARSTVHAAHSMTGLTRDTVERGEEYVRSAMRTGYRVHASTALFRTAAVRDLAYDAADFPATDFGLWLRLAASWDIAYVARPLAAYRHHEASYTAQGADVANHGYVQGVQMIRSIRGAKLRFLREHGYRYDDLRSLRRAARRAMREQLVNRAALLTLPDRSFPKTADLLWRAFLLDPRLVAERSAWRLLGASAIGPRAVERLKKRRTAHTSQAYS